LCLRELPLGDQPRMDVRNVLSAQHSIPGRHRPPSIQHSLPEQIIVLENCTLRKLRAYTTHSLSSVTSLTIVLIDTGSLGSHASERTFSQWSLRERLCLLHFAIEQRELLRRAWVIACRQIPHKKVSFIGGDLYSPMLHLLDYRLPAPAR